MGKPGRVADMAPDATDGSASRADSVRGRVVSARPMPCPRCMGGQMLIEEIEVDFKQWQPARVCQSCGFETAL